MALYHQNPPQRDPIRSNANPNSGGNSTRGVNASTSIPKHKPSASLQTATRMAREGTVDGTRTDSERNAFLSGMIVGIAMANLSQTKANDFAEEINRLCAAQQGVNIEVFERHAMTIAGAVLNASDSNDE